MAPNCVLLHLRLYPRQPGFASPSTANLQVKEGIRNGFIYFIYNTSNQPWQKNPLLPFEKYTDHRTKAGRETDQTVTNMSAASPLQVKFFPARPTKDRRPEQ